MGEIEVNKGDNFEGVDAHSCLGVPGNESRAVFGRVVIPKLREFIPA